MLFFSWLSLKRETKEAFSHATVCHHQSLLWIPGNEGGWMFFLCVYESSLLLEVTWRD